MKKILFTLAAASCLLIAGCSQTVEPEIGTGNPYLPLWEHLPDGEPRVFEDPDNPGHYRAYIIGSHDLRYGSYCGPDIRMWSAPVEDLTAWVDEGPIFTYNIDNQWDVMYAPDLVEVTKRDGTREYYLYPHSRGWGREALVAKSDRPDGPFTVINATEDGRRAVEGSILGFDPSIFVEQIDDPKDPDYEIGFRAYGYWGFQRSSAVELDQNTMYSARPDGTYIPYFIPASFRYGVVRQVPGVKEYPALYKDQKPEDFNFFEASSIRKVGNKYVMIFSGYSGPDYGLGSTNSALRYAYGDSPLGPWRSGGVLVDSRGVVPNEEGTHLTTTNFGHNTHGSIEQINGQWYVFYHRQCGTDEFSRQAMVAPINVDVTEGPGGKVVISEGEYTSEGFAIDGLDPLKTYSAGIACWYTGPEPARQAYPRFIHSGSYIKPLRPAVEDCKDPYDLKVNSNLVVNNTNGSIVGYKYFNFDKTNGADGLKLELGILPEGIDGTIDIMVDSPWSECGGKKVGSIRVQKEMPLKLRTVSADVAPLARMTGKHAVYLVISSEVDAQSVCEIHTIGFSQN